MFSQSTSIEGMSGERVGEASPRPIVTPKEDVWDLCVRLAEEHNTTPKDILNKMLFVGEKVLEVVDSGGKVTCTIGGVSKDIRVFNGGGNGNQDKPTAG